MIQDDDQFDLFLPSEAHARNTDPETSHEAAEEISGNQATRMEYEVLACLRRFPGGLTMHEICHLTGLRWNTASPRIKPLRLKGLVEDSGDRREGPVGRRCIVWKATPKQ